RRAPCRARHPAHGSRFSRPNETIGPLRMRGADLLGLEVLPAVRTSCRRSAAAPLGGEAVTDARPDYCPDCGVGYEPLQEYCLECGARLPTNRGVVGVLASSWQRRFAWYPGDWVWPTLLFLGLTILATAAAVVARAERSGGNRTLVATSPARSAWL